MYILATSDTCKVLGYSLWSGFNADGQSYRLEDIAITSFENFDMSVYVRIFTRMDSALLDAERINKIIASRCEKKIELFVLPLETLMHQMKFWASR